MLHTILIVVLIPLARHVFVYIYPFFICTTAPSDQKILLLTHLCYFGYCFNPVSFYYILRKGSEEFNVYNDNIISGSCGSGCDGDNVTKKNIEAIVAEVSNTPWNEMKCYVLHPDSIDMMHVKEGMYRKYFYTTSEDNYSRKMQTQLHSVNYIFQKKFHVSPFMDMDHIYDWTFWHLTGNQIIVSTTMKKIQAGKQAEIVDTNDKSIENSNHGDSDMKSKSSSSFPLEETVTYFNAFFDIQRVSFHPFFICYQLIRFPVYCMIIQIWIHVQAFKLFVKGVEFIPHPEGSETIASRMIGHAMAPFFALKDVLFRGDNDNGKDSTIVSRQEQGHDKVD